MSAGKRYWKIGTRQPELLICAGRLIPGAKISHRHKNHKARKPVVMAIPTIKAKYCEIWDIKFGLLYGSDESQHYTDSGTYIGLFIMAAF